MLPPLKTKILSPPFKPLSRPRFHHLQHHGGDLQLRVTGAGCYTRSYPTLAVSLKRNNRSTVVSSAKSFYCPFQVPISGFHVRILPTCGLRPASSEVVGNMILVVSIARLIVRSRTGAGISSRVLIWLSVTSSERATSKLIAFSGRICISLHRYCLRHNAALPFHKIFGNLPPILILVKILASSVKTSSWYQTCTLSPCDLL
ncbi:hypothetical protein F5X98DRAFT_334696 [Xylaria grammica]|nr:hypothetical protein F5X98DRAFT_334696 [Xylaria grammica]